MGELTANNTGTTGTEALFVKLIRSTNFTPKTYTWDLMMKNVYSLGGFNISRKKKFRLDVLYRDDRIGGFVNFISEGCSDVKDFRCCAS